MIASTSLRDRVRTHWRADEWPQTPEGFELSGDERLLGSIVAGVVTGAIMFAVMVPGVLLAIGLAEIVNGWLSVAGHGAALTGGVVGYRVGEPVGAAVADHLLGIPRLLE